MKKAFDQTVRDIKRGVNKKVLKVPGIEQKVLDATSNEPWGPHGSLLADIADASRNYHEYQMIMGVILKRISDTGKNWRHVYKGLTVLEYLVANGSERVIEEIRERAYQISTLSNFQYIDSSGRDQGNNVRRKSQSLVALVNDKERIAEVREKAAANRDKFRSSASGGMYRPSSYSGSGYSDRYDYGRERESVYRDDDRYSRDGDRYSRYSEERYGRDGYKDDDYRGRSRSVDNYQFGSRSRSSDRDRGFDDDARSSSRGSGARAEDTQDGRRPLERKFSEQNIGAPPSYEEVVSESRSPVQNERDGEASPVSAPGASSPATEYANKGTDRLAGESSPAHQKVDSFNDFDPRGHPTSLSGSSTSTIAAFPATSSNVEMDLLGSLSDSFSSNSLAVVPVDYASAEPNSNANSASAPSFSAAQQSTQQFDDPFGESPFKAIPSLDSNQIPLSSGSPSLTTTATGTDVFDAHPPSQAMSQKESFTSQNETDILAGILPLSGLSVSLPSQPAVLDSNMDGSFHPQTAPNVAAQTSFGQAAHSYNMGSQPQNFPGGSFFQPQGPAGSGSTQNPYQAVPPSSQLALNDQSTHNGGNFLPRQGFAVPAQHNGVQGGLSLPVGPSASMGSQTTLSGLTGALALVPQPSKEKFEPKSAVWADTLNRGLVNLNISGPKTNPLADIGVDFDALNRKEKRLEKPTSTPVTSTVTMGKAMGSGSGLGRAGSASLRPPLNPVTGGGYGGMNQPIGMNMGGMNLGTAQSGYTGQQHQGMVSGPAMRGGYNPMMGSGGNNPQRPYYGGGYQ